MNCNAMASLRDATRTPAVGIAIGYGDASFSVRKFPCASTIALT
ncbi:MAG: hypothetical protein RM022_002010 [Nostoc sp. EfeVER01]|nr:hypothetical protein [Nostoc sp. EfeVER01]MDZ7947695.1 hypothetical protein [Nostoc sp. EfeVER01]